MKKPHCKHGHPRIKDNIDKFYNCKVCTAIRGAAWRAANPRRVKRWRKANRARNRKHVRNYYATHPLARTIRNHRRRARLRGCAGTFTASEWSALIAACDALCLHCQKRRRLTPDHVIPLCKGGSNDIGNIQPLCQSCNSRKGTKCTDYRTQNKQVTH